MKYLTTSLCLLFAAFVHGQYDHHIQLNNGTVITHSVTEIDSISFSHDGVPTLQMKLFGGSSETFDLENIDQVTFSGEPMADPQYPEGTVHCLPGGTPTAVVEVLNPLTGKIWMDRNLGAAQAATALDDEAAYGDLYQWGRFSDGHQCRNSPIYPGIADDPNPNADNAWDGQFIVQSPSPFSWLSFQADDLWQGPNGINNPCPTGFRLPTSAEWTEERSSWTEGNNSAGAIASPLKLPAAGYRSNWFDQIFEEASLGHYWSSSLSGTSAGYLGFIESIAVTEINVKAFGFSVRCIKD